MFATTKMVMFTRKHIGCQLMWLWRAQQNDVDCACSENVNNRKKSTARCWQQRKTMMTTVALTTTPITTAVLTTTTMKWIAHATPWMISMTTVSTSCTDCTCTDLYFFIYCLATAHTLHIKKPTNNNIDDDSRTTVTATASVTISWNGQTRQTDTHSNSEREAEKKNGRMDRCTDRQTHAHHYLYTHNIWQVTLHNMLYHALHPSILHTHSIRQVLLCSMLDESIMHHTLHAQHALSRTAPLHIAYTWYMAGDATQHAAWHTTPLRIACTRHMTGDASHHALRVARWFDVRRVVSPPARLRRLRRLRVWRHHDVKIVHRRWCGGRLNFSSASANCLGYKCKRTNIWTHIYKDETQLITTYMRKYAKLKQAGR